MTLAIRLEKLRFLVSEMRVAYILTSAAPNSFVARTLALHVIVRAKDFIGHTRALRRPLMQAGFDVKYFHSTKEVYARDFADHFQIARDRLAAHVQDFDFWKRILHWNDIEIRKIQHLADGAEELYRHLASLNIPSYVPYTEPAELSDPAFKAALGDFGWDRTDKNHVEMSSDPLAATRDNTSAVMSGGDLNARGGQLALIRRWVTLQTPLLEKFAAFPSVVRIIKARLITDIVSFDDALVTRSVTPGAPQEMDGIDKLIVAQGGSAKIIADFVASSRFDVEVARTRDVRNKIGAHLEVSDTVPLATLLALLDGFDLGAALKFFELTYAAFRKIAIEFLPLRLFAADGARIHGVTPSKISSVPYSGSAPEVPVQPPAPYVFDAETLQANLQRWLDGDEEQKANARHYYYQAFMNSALLETINDPNAYNYAYWKYPHRYREAHKVIEDFLRQCSDNDYFAALQLLERCRDYAQVEILVRTAPNQLPVIRHSAMCRTIGEMASLPHDSAQNLLLFSLHHPIWSVRLEATLALVKIYIRSEGQHRFNNKNGVRLSFDIFVKPLLARLTPEERLIAMLGVASAMTGQRLATFQSQFKNEIDSLLIELEAVCMAQLKQPVGEEQRKALTTLISQRDFVGVAVLLAGDMQDRTEVKLSRACLIDAAGRQAIDGYGPQSGRHLAMALLMGEHYDYALAQAKNVAEANPDNLVFQYTVLCVLYNTPGADEAALREIDRLRTQFRLDEENEKSVAEAEAIINARTAMPNSD